MARRWIASDKSSRLPISTFQLALKLHGVDVDSDEVECMVANMIYRVGLVYVRSLKGGLTYAGLHEGVYLPREADGRVGED